MNKIITLTLWKKEHPSADLLHICTNHISAFYRNKMGDNMYYTVVRMDDGSYYRVEETTSDISMKMI